MGTVGSTRSHNDGLEVSQSCLSKRVSTNSTISQLYSSVRVAGRARVGWKPPKQLMITRLVLTPTRITDIAALEIT